MTTLTKLILEQGLANRFLKVSQLDRLAGGSARRRYGLVNRAIKAGELVQIQRGLYMVAERYRSFPFHPFALAQAIAPGSYISFETALAFHGWIPEKVFSTASVIPGRQSHRLEKEKLGAYSFHPLAVHRIFFLEMVSNHVVDHQGVLIAEPSRALMDLVCLRKLEWTSVAFLLEGLRIDRNLLDTIKKNDVLTLQRVYKHKRVFSFLSELSRELHID